jgi:hypothetical protein
LLPRSTSKPPASNPRCAVLHAIASLSVSAATSSIHHLDGEKWFVGRLFDKPMDQLDEKKQRLRTLFEKIGQESGFSEKAFMRSKAGLSIAVPTMWF